MRGLRLKCGIDVGNVKSSVSSLSARMEFRGKVWVSDAAWKQAQPDINLHKVLVEGGGTPSPTYQPHTPAPAPPPGLGYSWTARAAPEQIIAVDVGQHQLKGIQGMMSLKHVTFNDTGSSLVPAPPSPLPLTFTSRSVSNLWVPSF
ncbi:hypothetical protein HaLaN_01837 [Haematococcus lacustris]|uniref:Uncharacterized protein n=1 Tax=Haematococcus lacustris TaxID=44745 RepID=A0A699YJA8_HAELA|nr:hypothetical protein HaLaN_01837 [Haematococcus lacustris]